MSDNSKDYIKKLKKAILDFIPKLPSKYPDELVVYAKNHKNNVRIN